MLKTSAAIMRTCMLSQGHGQRTARASVSAVLHHETASLATTWSCRTAATIRCEAATGREGPGQPRRHVTATESSRQRGSAHARPQQDELTEASAKVKRKQHRDPSDKPREKQYSTGDKRSGRSTAYTAKQGTLKQYNSKVTVVN